MNVQTPSYWVTTGLVAFFVGAGGAAQVAQLKANAEGLVHLGYPLYFGTILGVCKLFGTLAILVPRFPRLKEWAYAGIVFDLTGAAVSHLTCGDALWHVLAPIMIAGLAVASWALRPQSRTLGTVFSLKSAPGHRAQGLGRFS